MRGDKSKADIRTLILAQRQALGGELRIEKSLLAAEFARDKIQFEPGTIISGYSPIRGEIDPRPLMDHLRQRGAQLCLPVVTSKTTIIFRALLRGAELVDAGFGTVGPGASADVVTPQIMMMPLAVFDNKGGRIGYGAGHYDRAIARLAETGMKPKLIGMAFDCQRVDNVPQEKHDVAMDAIVTESGYLEF